MLTDMLEKIIKMEREAFGITSAPPEDAAPNSPASFLSNSKHSALPIVMEGDDDDNGQKKESPALRLGLNHRVMAHKGGCAGHLHCPARTVNANP
jgi:hypothetical protein